MPLDLIQYTGVALGLAGAILVSSSQRSRRRLGFALWLGSNACLITWALSMAAWGLLGMYAIYTVTSTMGWWNNRDEAPRPEWTATPTTVG
jgi:hypothetical protein